MTTYFTAPDGHGEPTLWLYTDDPRYPVAILRMRDLGPLHGHWDELVARVIAGNPSAARNKLANAIDDLTRTPSPPSQGLMQVIPVDRRLEHIQGQIIANGVAEAEFRGRLDRAVGEAWAAGYREAEYERNQAE